MPKDYSPLNELRMGRVLRGESALQPDTSYVSRFTTISSVAIPTPYQNVIVELPLNLGMFEHDIYGAILSTQPSDATADDWFVGYLEFSSGERPIIRFPVEVFVDSIVGGPTAPQFGYQSIFSASTIGIQNGLFINFNSNSPPLPSLICAPFRYSGSVDRVRLVSVNSVIARQQYSFLAIKSFNSI